MTSRSLSTLGPFDFFMETIKSWSIKFSPRFMTYFPNHEIEIVTKKYILKTACSSDELVEIFKLRYQSFKESAVNQTEIYDTDQFDHICDHFIIRSREDNQIVGTCRVMCSTFTNSFYSQEEFNIEQFIALPATKMELGRVCIHHAHRNGNVIDLLWKGIAAYTKITKAEYLFGCTSIKTTENKLAYDLYEYFREKEALSQEFDIMPTNRYKMNFLNCGEADIASAKKYVPSLLRSYMTAGAKIYGPPAVDHDFNCIDFLTILKLSDITSSFKRRYFSEERYKHAPSDRHF